MRHVSEKAPMTPAERHMFAARHAELSVYARLRMRGLLLCTVSPLALSVMP